MSRLDSLKPLLYFVPGIGEYVYYKSGQKTVNFLEERLTKDDFNNLVFVDKEPKQSSAIMSAGRTSAIVIGSTSYILPSPARETIMAMSLFGYLAISFLFYGGRSYVLDDYSKEGEVTVFTKNEKHIVVR